MELEVVEEVEPLLGVVEVVVQQLGVVEPLEVGLLEHRHSLLLRVEDQEVEVQLVDILQHLQQVGVLEEVDLLVVALEEVALLLLTKPQE